MQNKIGFIQGRLSPLINGKIQAFPWPYWRQEFAVAGEYGFHLMEWTLDQDNLDENPLMNEAGRKEIFDLSARHGVTICSLTGDCFMQAPFYKATGNLQLLLLEDMRRVLESCAHLKIEYVVIPLVDNGRLENPLEEEILFKGLERIIPILKDGKVRVLFESDYPPKELAAFIDKLDSRYFGINYDIGNSASLGYQPDEEIPAYGNRIWGVHVKDRLRNGGTVPLGEGDADIPLTLKTLRSIGYDGYYILQTARAADGNHIGVLCNYRNMLENWLKELEAGGPST